MVLTGGPHVKSSGFAARGRLGFRVSGLRVSGLFTSSRLQTINLPNRVLTSEGTCSSVGVSMHALQSDASITI